MFGAREESLTDVASAAEVYQVLGVIVFLGAFIIVIVNCTSRSDKHQLQDGAERSPTTGSGSHVVCDLTASCVQCCREIWQKPPEESEDEDDSAFRNVTIVITPPSPKMGAKRTPSDSDAECDATKDVIVFVNNNNNSSNNVNDDGSLVASKSSSDPQGHDSVGKSDFLQTR